MPELYPFPVRQPFTTVQGADPTGVTDSSNVFIAAANSLGSRRGVVFIPPGKYIVQNLPLYEGLYWVGAGAGKTDGTTGTYLTLPAVPSANMFVAASGSSTWYGGGVRDLYAYGGGTTTYDCIDLSGRTGEVHNFVLENCWIDDFRRGWSGPEGGATGDRYCKIAFCHFSNCVVGAYIPKDHPDLTHYNDYRNCTYGIQGAMYDGLISSQVFVDNDYGVAPISQSSSIRQCKFVNCTFFANAVERVRIHRDNVLSNCMFRPDTGSSSAGLVITGDGNTVTGCKFERESTEIFANGCITFDLDTPAASCEGNVITGNSFAVPGSNVLYHLASAGSRDITSLTFSNNNCNDTLSIYRRSSTFSAIFYSTFSGNTFRMESETLTSAVTGTSVTLTNGATTCVGVGTSFQTQFKVGDYIRLQADADTAWARISAIASDLSMTLSANYSGTGGTAAAYGSRNWLDIENDAANVNCIAGNLFAAYSATPQRMVFAIGGDLRNSTVVGNAIRRGNASGVDTANSAGATIASNGYLA